MKKTIWVSVLIGLALFLAAVLGLYQEKRNVDSYGASYKSYERTVISAFSLPGRVVVELAQQQGDWQLGEFWHHRKKIHFANLVIYLLGSLVSFLILHGVRGGEATGSTSSQGRSQAWLTGSRGSLPK